MRTKTMLLSALLGTLGSVSLMAQSTNVYSLNVVGYVQVVLPAGYTIVSCPLISSPDNTLATLFNNSTGTYKGWKFYFFTGGQGYTQIDVGEKTGYQDGGTNTINPGQAIFVQNTGTTTVTNIFVGTVPTGSLTNTLSVGYNLVSSILPSSGDIATNSLTLLTNGHSGDTVYVYSTNGYSSPGGIYKFGAKGVWQTDPVVPSVGEGFFYENVSTAAESWVENYSVSQ
jgi:hypothetical protein